MVGSLLKWLHLFKQLSAYNEKRRSGHDLWQEGHWDYTLRDHDAVLAIASYIVRNPVEARLATRPEHYPYVGSQRFTVTELAAVSPHKPVGQILDHRGMSAAAKDCQAGVADTAMRPGTERTRMAIPHQ